MAGIRNFHFGSNSSSRKQVDPGQTATILLVASTNNDLVAIFDISDPPNTSHLTNFTSAQLDAPVDVAVEGDYLYVTGTVSDSLVIVDISTPSAPSQVSYLQDATNYDHPRGVHVVGDICCFAARISDAAYQIDVSDKANPVQVDAFLTSRLDNARAVHINKAGTHLWATGQTYTAVFADLSDPPNASKVGEYQHSVNGNPFYITLNPSETHAFVSVGGYDKVDILDITDPTTPTLAASYTDTINNPHQLTVVDDVLYVACRDNDRLVAVDVSDPTTPGLLGSLHLGSNNHPKGVFVDNGYAYISGAQSGDLYVVDVSDAAAMSLVTTISGVLSNPSRLAGK